MLRRSRSALSFLVFLFPLAGCGDDAKAPEPPPPAPVAVACDVHATKGAARFTDRSEAWGLSAAKIVGNRIMSGDLNGDGYPDLILHAIGTNNREVIGEGPRLVYVLMNEPGPAGGRVFVDRTIESGYAAAKDSATELRSAQLALFADVDNDGDLDVWSGVYTAPDKVATPPTPADLDRSVLLLNDGKGHLTAAPPSAVSPKTGRPTTGASFVDVDRNGIVDLFVGYFATSTPSTQQLLLGNGDGTFNDVSTPAGVTTAGTRRAAYGITTCDLDDDGAPELLVSAYARGPNVLYRSDMPGHWVDVGVEAKFAYDENQTYTDNEMFKCYCTLHTDQADCMGVSTPLIQCPAPADSYWSPVADTKPPRLGGNTFTTVCSDIDGDGKLDLYNAEIAHWWAGQSSDFSSMLVNRSAPGTIQFERPDRESRGLSWEHPTSDWNEGGIMAAAADLDNDGREDLLVGASDYPDQYGLYFHNKGNGTFAEIGEAQGFHHPCTSGMTVADFDRDGDLDIVVGSGTARDCSQIWSSNEVHIYENDANQQGHFLAVKLVGDGTTTNRAGIGARVTVDANGTKLVRELGGGYGHMAMQNDTVVFFGLGACAIVHAIEVTWPNGARTVERFENVVADRLIEIRQGDPKVYDGMPAP
ncbi:MAG TPA: CRTAC1 family protein [Polyangium sp.]|nr:CRTAC1 family protein [Polyangium sp.]